MHPEIMTKLHDASQQSGFTQNEIIVRLLKRAMEEIENFYPKELRRVKYQERDEDARWKPFHVTYKFHEYESFNDMRKIYKLSVSNILAIAVRKYLKREIYEMTRSEKSPNTDNNQFFSYASVGEMVGGVMVWRFY
jgi:hypothetical protein